MLQIQVSGYSLVKSVVEVYHLVWVEMVEVLAGRAVAAGAPSPRAVSGSEAKLQIDSHESYCSMLAKHPI
jgi:hypothetical protein